MFKNVSDNGFLSILHSCVKKPLLIWDKKIRSGHIRRIMDNELQCLVLELKGKKLNNTYLTCPGNYKKTLGVKFPVIILTIKYLYKYFAFDIQILDDNNVRRKFKISTLVSQPDVKPFTCKLPLVLTEGWNQIAFSLQEYTKKIYNTNYYETLRIQVYPNCRIQRIYFTDEIPNEDPSEYNNNNNNNNNNINKKNNILLDSQYLIGSLKKR
ncbi:orf protein, putative [Pediculus humanus corporis]|uniref:Orf protein, putative n=1 Tax=Pediculus humanus subsp. corporis TaxID=121224 RepID=E0VCB8_PEDHC|nr:orf protein, putative [Pediculus humanus corporis]EEB11004.1 orf protein, putative [Pediculus humanus corporis]